MQRPKKLRDKWESAEKKKLLKKRVDNGFKRKKIEWNFWVKMLNQIVNILGEKEV